MKKLFLMVFGLVVLLFLSSCIESNSNEELKLKIREGLDTIEINSQWIDQGAYLLLDSIEIEASSTHQVDTSVLGNYQVQYEITHEEIVYQVMRTVIVVDQVPPVISLNPGIDTIKRGSLWIDAFVTVSDNSNALVTVVISGFVNTEEVGQYQITYTATDESGNSSNTIRIITVYE